MTEDRKVKDEDAQEEKMKIQYNKLSEYWMQFNTILWGIPAVAVSIMAGIIVVAYQPGLAGWPRFISLVIGSLFLFALTIEVIKKRVHMYVISDILKQLQGEKFLNLDEDLRFPVGISKDVENYWDDKRWQHFGENVGEPEGDWLYLKFRGLLARKYLANVIFLAAIAVAILAVLDIAVLNTLDYTVGSKDLIT